MLNCEQATRAAGDFIEQRLGLRARVAMRLHLALCTGCRTYIEQFRFAMRGLQSLPAPRRAPATEELVARFRTHSHTRRT